MTPRELEALSQGSRGEVARALNTAELQDPSRQGEILALIDALSPRFDASGIVIGLTGAPGVGKSTLAGQLIRAWRARGLRVGMLAIDPSSRGGGALLGDRIRLDHGADSGVFVRSMAARGQHGGLAPGAFAAVLVLRSAFDRVILETVGAGQGEFEVKGVADVTLLLLQPDAGDAVQFIKSGIMEEPDLFVLNKADGGVHARRAAHALTTAVGGHNGRPVLQCQASEGEGIDEVVAAIKSQITSDAPTREARRRDQARQQIARAFRERNGARGVAQLGGPSRLEDALDAFPTSTWSRCLAELEQDR